MEWRLRRTFKIGIVIAACVEGAVDVFLMESVKVTAEMWMIISQGEWTGAVNVYLVGPRILVLGRDLVEEVLIVRGEVHGSVSRRLIRAARCALLITRKDQALLINWTRSTR